MDIRRIDLTKMFSRFGRGERFSKEPQNGWVVWGYYDYMTVEKVNQRANELFLHTILRDSHDQSLNLNGEKKHHVIYAVDALGRSKDNDTFWNEAENQEPFFLVSLIHVNADILSIKNKEEMNKLADQLDSDSRDKNKKINYSDKLYFGIDSSDVIIFWRTWNIENVLKEIVKIYSTSPDRFSDIFTIQSFNCSYLENGKIEKLDAYYQSLLKSTLTRVIIYLRSENFRHLSSVLVDLKKTLSNNNVNVYDNSFFVPGQEDACIMLSDCPVDILLKLYQKDSRIHECGISSRAEVMADQSDFIIPINDENHDYRTTENYDLSQQIKDCFTDNSPLTNSIWCPPLCELVNEFSSMANAGITDDIFYQGFRSVCALLQILAKRENNKILSDTDLKLISESMLKYIRGWSQLSFHALRAQWQLTQTADINRLYIFSPKMGLIYHGFMTLVNDLLLSSPEEYVKDDNNRSSYFLTPQLCSNATFTSVFLNINCDNHLILGEIPADLFFKPDILLPILVHEAAHYSGTYPRNRRQRNKLILLSGLEYIVVSSISVFEQFDDQRLRLASHITGYIWLSSLKEKYKSVCGGKDSHDRSHDYSRIAENEITEFLIDFINDYGGINKFSAWVAHTAAEMMPSGDKLTRKYIIEQNLSVDSKSSERIISVGALDDGNLATYIKSLFAIYREAFSDMCMVKLLGLTMRQYLEVIVSSKEHEPEWIDNTCRYVRYCIIIIIMRERQVKGWNKMNTSDVNESEAAQLLKSLENRINENKKGTNLLLNPYAMESLMIYMNEAYDRLEKINTPYLIGEREKNFVFGGKPETLRQHYSQLTKANDDSQFPIIQMLDVYMSYRKKTQEYISKKGRR